MTNRFLTPFAYLLNLEVQQNKLSVSADIERQCWVNAFAAMVVPGAAPGPRALPGCTSMSEPMICLVGALLFRNTIREAGPEFQIGEEEGESRILSLCPGTVCRKGRCLHLVLLRITNSFWFCFFKIFIYF